MRISDLCKQSSPGGRGVLDLRLADGEGPRPLVVFIHGGAWVGSGLILTLECALDNGIRRKLMERITFFCLYFMYCIPF